MSGLPLLPSLAVLTAADMTLLQTATAAAAADAHAAIDQLFKEKQTEYMQAEGNLLPGLSGFKSLLRDLVLATTFSHIGGAIKPKDDNASTNDAGFNSRIRTGIVELIKRNLEISENPAQPTHAQIALVDIFWLVWSDLDQFKKLGGPSSDADHGLLRDRLVGFVTILLSTKKSAGVVVVDGVSSDQPAVPLIPPRFLRETIQQEFLDSLGIYAAVGMSKQMVSVRTSAWYRQQKFNLLREETEGFSKLFTELTTFFLLPSQQTNVHLLVKKVQAFIGFFDLDPNRVIDIILDSFERSGLTASTGQLGNFLILIDQFQKENVLQILGFKFRNYYQQYTHAQSSGAKVSTLIGVAPQSLYDLAAVLIKTGRIQLEALYTHLSPTDELMALARSDLLAEEKRKLSKMNVVSLASKRDGGDDEKEEKKKPAAAAPLSMKDRNDQGISCVGQSEPKEEISLVLSGTPIASLQLEIEKPTPPPSAAASSTGTPTPVTPTNALPPMTPKVSIRATSQSSASSAAAIPPSATPAPPATVNAPTTPLPPVPTHPNQKFCLVAALLNQNAFNYADVLLNHLSGLNPSANPSAGGALIEFVGRMIRPLYLPIATAHRRFATTNTRGTAPSEVSAKVDATHSVDAMPTDDTATFFQWSLLTDAQVEERFNAPLPLQTYQAALPTILRVLKYLHIYLCNDVSLWSRLCRVLSYVIAASKKAKNSSDAPAIDPIDFTPSKEQQPIVTITETLLVEILIPAFALMPSSHGSSEELWGVLKQLPYEMRYRLYGYWHSTLYETHPELMLLKSSVLYRAKYFRKRIAAARVKECSRLLVKFAENNTILVFELLLQQIQSFDNMINPVTESMKLLHPLAFDCVAFVLLQQLSSSKPKLSDDGINETHWLQSLATFTGVFFQRYPEVDLTALLQFVLNQVRSSHSVDLLILKDLLVGMSNIEIHEEVSEQEMDGRAGGKIIQAETTTIRDKNKNKGKPTRVLLDAILRNRLALPLWISIAQQKNHLTFEYDSEHVKLISEMYDKCHEALLHVIAFMEQTLAHTDQQYAGQFCSIEEMVIDYHIKPSDAFHALRRVLKQTNMQCKEQPTDAPMDVDTNVGDAVMVDVAAKVSSDPPSPYAPLISCVRKFLPSHVWCSLTPQFYTLFWRLALSNLHVPKSTYETHILKLKSLIPALDSPNTVGTNTQAGAPKTELQKKQSRNEKERINKTILALGDELLQQTKDVEAVFSDLTREKDTWFDASITDHAASMATFLHTCVVPRVLHSGIDAHYTAKFLSTIVKLNTPHFAYLDLFDQLFKCVGAIISSCSVNEASRFGRFLKEMLHELHAFAYDEARFKEIILESPSCFTKVGAAPDSTPLSFAHVTMEVKKYHLRLSKIFGRTLSADAGSTKTEQNNALLLLCKIGTEWPRTYSQGTKIESLLETIMAADENKNTALKLMSTRSHAQLQGQKKTWIQDIPIPKPAPPAAKIKPAAAATPTTPKESTEDAATKSSDAQPASVKEEVVAASDVPKDSKSPSVKVEDKDSNRAASATSVGASKPPTGKSDPKLNPRTSPPPTNPDEPTRHDRARNSQARSRDDSVAERELVKFNQREQQQRDRDANQRERERGSDRDRNERDRNRDRDPKAEQRAMPAAADREKDKEKDRPAASGRERERERATSDNSTRASSSATASGASSKNKLNPHAREFTPSPAKPANERERERDRERDPRDRNRDQRERDTRDNNQRAPDKLPQRASSGDAAPRDDRRVEVKPGNKRGSSPPARRDDKRGSSPPAPRRDDRVVPAASGRDVAASSGAGVTPSAAASTSDTSKPRNGTDQTRRDNRSDERRDDRIVVPRKEEHARGGNAEKDRQRERDRDRDRPNTNNSTGAAPTPAAAPAPQNRDQSHKRKREDDAADSPSAASSTGGPNIGDRAPHSSDSHDSRDRSGSDRSSHPDRKRPRQEDRDRPQQQHRSHQQGQGQGQGRGYGGQGGGGGGRRR